MGWGGVGWGGVGGARVCVGDQGLEERDVGRAVQVLPPTGPSESAVPSESSAQIHPRQPVRVSGTGGSPPAPRHARRIRVARGAAPAVTVTCIFRVMLGCLPARSRTH